MSRPQTPDEFSGLAKVGGAATADMTHLVEFTDRRGKAHLGPVGDATAVGSPHNKHRRKLVAREDMRR
jgi:hypothetical protein